MIAIHTARVLNVQKGFLTEIATQYKNATLALRALLSATIDPADKFYVDEIYKFWTSNPDILTLLPDDLEKLKKSAPNVPKKPVTRIRNGNPYTALVDSSIKKKVVEALGYESLRSKFYPHYFYKLGLKNCVYCNAQMALSLRVNKKVFSSKFDVDHYNPKSKFPWMSVSLFNLYPSCVPCNRAKSSKPVYFKLYDNDSSRLKKSDFSFRLTAGAKARYLTTKDYQTLTFTFSEPATPTGYLGHDKVFHISEIYNTQLDVAEQLLLSSQMYDSANKKALFASFSKLGLSPELFRRVILGTYPDSRDLHKRAMSKFMQDIAGDLGML